MHMSILVLRSRRCLVEISRVTDRSLELPTYIESAVSFQASRAGRQCPVDRLSVIGGTSSCASVSLSQVPFDRDCASQVVTDLIEAIDAGDHALLGLLDLLAAFDTVDHDVLVERLARTYGLRSTALDWLRSYLL